jgi:tellurite resistance protein
MLGRTGGMAFNTAARETTKTAGQGPSNKEIKEAIVKAFLMVAGNFHYDQETKEWFKASDPPPPPPKSPYEEQWNTNPIVDPHDLDVFARIIAELAYADGTIAKEEAEFFREIIDSLPSKNPTAPKPSLDKLAKSDPVSRIEAQEVTQGVKATIFMTAWVIAAIDLDIDPVEEELLMEYADVFELPEARREELTRSAKYFVMEQNIDPDIPREELFELSAKIKLSNDEAERCRIAYKRRVG